MKRLCLLFVLLVISTSVFGYFSVINGDGTLEARVCSLGYYAINTTDDPPKELTFPPVGTPCPYNDGQGFILVLDGVEFRQEYSGGVDPETVNIDEYHDGTYMGSSIVVTRWNLPSIHGDVVVSQKIYPDSLDGLQLFAIKYEVFSHSLLPHTIGLRSIIDVNIEDLDDIYGMFFDTGIPPLWRVNFIDGADTMYIIGYNDISCDEFGFGNAFCMTAPSKGVKLAGFDFDDDCWIGQPIIDVCVSSKWNPAILESGDTLIFKTYLGIDNREGIEEKQMKPVTYSNGIYPNPFNSVCSFDVPEGTEIAIYDIYGRLIENLGEKRTWTPIGINSGVYFAKCTRSDSNDIKRIIYVK